MALIESTQNIPLVVKIIAISLTTMPLWWQALAAMGASWLGNKLFGSKPTPPSESLYSINLEPWYSQKSEALRGQVGDWFNQALRGIHATASTRGLSNTSFPAKYGRFAAKEGGKMYANALADMYGKGLGMQAALRGKFGDAYMQHQGLSAQAGADWWSQLAKMLTMVDWNKLGLGGGNTETD
jgi:hypothetical protein